MTVLSLKDGVRGVGCVFIADKEFFDYTYIPERGELVLDIPLESIGEKTIRVSRLDTDRSYLASQEGYNYGGGAICLDRGNRSVYYVDEQITFTLFDDKNAVSVVLTAKDGKSWAYSLENSVDMKNKTHTLTLKIPEEGYYTASALDKEGEVLGTQEFMVYGDMSAVILNAYSDKGNLIPETGMIRGRLLSHDTNLKPMYVSRVGVTGVVYDTAPIDEDGGFEISCGEDGVKTYLKFHFTCNYGRVTTPAFRVFYGKECK